MFKGKKLLKTYLIAAICGLYAYIIQKLYYLDWFSSVDFPTLLFYGFFMLAIPVAIYNFID